MRYPLIKGKFEMVRRSHIVITSKLFRQEKYEDVENARSGGTIHLSEMFPNICSAHIL